MVSTFKLNGILKQRGYYMVVAGGVREGAPYAICWHRPHRKTRSTQSIKELKLFSLMIGNYNFFGELMGVAVAVAELVYIASVQRWNNNFGWASLSLLSPPPSLTHLDIVMFLLQLFVFNWDFVQTEPAQTDDGARAHTGNSSIA